MIKKNMFNQRGKVSIDFLVVMVVLIVSFFMVLAILAFVNWTGNIDRTACHQSVITKGAIPDVGGGIAEVKDFVSLKCKTEKLCVTDNQFLDGDCETLGSEQGNARVKTFKVREGVELQENQARKFIADEMIECWETMGEGKLQIFSQEFGFGDASRTACVVCSRLAFDEDVQKNLPEIKGVALYMIENTKPDSDQTYWEFLTGSKASAEGLTENFDLFFAVDRLTTTEEKSLVFMEVRKTTWGEWATAVGLGGSVGIGTGIAAGAAIGTAIPIPFVGTFVGAGVGLVVGAATGYAAGYAGHSAGEALTNFAADFDGNYISAQFLLDTDKVKELKCDSFEHIP